MTDVSFRLLGDELRALRTLKQPTVGVASVLRSSAGAGLVSHPQHELARRQIRAFGAMIAVEVDGSPDDARRFLERCRLFTLAESLGVVESLISLPALMTHASTPREARAALGITDRLVRISVGIEDDDDLIADLKVALG